MNEIQKRSINKARCGEFGSGFKGKLPSKIVKKGKRTFLIGFSIEPGYENYCWLVSASLETGLGRKLLKKWNQKDKNVALNIFERELYGVGVKDKSKIIEFGVVKEMPVYCLKYMRALTYKELVMIGTNGHKGSKFEDFLEEEGIKEEVENNVFARGIERVKKAFQEKVKKCTLKEEGFEAGSGPEDPLLLQAMTGNCDKCGIRLLENDPMSWVDPPGLYCGKCGQAYLDAHNNQNESEMEKTLKRLRKEAKCGERGIVFDDDNEK